MEKLFTESNLAEHEDLPFNLQGEVDLPVLQKVEGSHASQRPQENRNMKPFSIKNNMSERFYLERSN